MITLITTLYREDEDIFKRCFDRAFPYVDRAVVVHDDSISDEFLTWMLRCGIEAYLKKWDENLSNQKNYALQQVKEGEWVLELDPDEIISKQLGQNLRQIIKDSDDGKNYNIVSFKCLDILKTDKKEIILHSVPEWEKELFYKYQKGMHYIRPTHQKMCANLKGSKAPFLFYHIKTPEKWFRQYCNYYWRTGERIEERSKIWEDFREMCALVNNITSWKELHRRMKEGTLPDSIKEWIKEWRNDTYCVERRAFWTYYFEYLHPEQKPKGLKQDGGKLISIGNNVISLDKILEEHEKD